MSSFAYRLRLLVLLVLLVGTLPTARPAYAQTITVNSVDDTENATCPTTCTLRDAINLANDSVGPDTITFNIAGTAPHTINLTTPLPPLSDVTGGTTIEVPSAHTVVLNGGGISGNASGLQIMSANNVVRGLVIIDFYSSAPEFGGSGITLTSSAATNNVIANNWIGLDSTGTAVGNEWYGVHINEGANNNIIGGSAAGEGNVIAGNLRANIAVDDSDTFASSFLTDNQIIGNYIGIDPTGTTIPTGVIQTNLAAGVFVGTYARNTLIKGNRIGGHTGNTTNNAAGIILESPDAQITSTRHPQDTTIIGNAIGVTSTGTNIANRNGIRISRGAINTVIGDPADPVGGRNVIGWSTEAGIQILDNTYTVSGTQIVGNYIGIAQDGTTPATIGSPGVSNYQNAAIYLGTVIDLNSPVTIGPANVIASARRFGIRIRSSNNVVKGNHIGTNAAGTATSTTSASTDTPRGYSFGDSGIWVENGSGNQIGGPNGGDRNVIAAGGGATTSAAAAVVLMPGGGNIGGCGVSVTCSVTATTIQGNYLGVSAKGDAALAASVSSSSEGVRITNNDSLGSTTTASSTNTVRGNVISGLGTGIRILKGASNNTIDANLIGTRASGVLTSGQAIRNNQHGISLLQGTGNLITSNIIAFNGNDGIGSSHFYGINVDNTTGGANNNTIRGNRLVGNGDGLNNPGIYINGPTGILISQTTTSSHTGDGIKFGVTGSNGNMAAPTLTSVSGSKSAAALAGSATCSSGNCTVEVFTSSVSEDKEGPVYLTSAPISGGSFSIDITGCMQYLTATVRDNNNNNNTSPFSTVFNSASSGACTESGFTLSAAAPSAQFVDVGSTYTYAHSISNSAPIARTFTVVITSTQGWASAPTMVTVPPTSSAPFNVVVSVPYSAKTTPTADVDTTSVQVFVGPRGSNVVSDVTTAKNNTPTPATAAVSPGQTKERTGDTLTFTHTVTNTGQVAGIFSVTGPSGSGLPAFLSTPPTGWSILSATLGQSNLSAGAHTTLTIVVNTPAGAPAVPVQFSFIIKVNNGTQTNPATVDTITVPVVRNFDFSAITPTTVSRPPSAPASFSYTITNTGNASDTFQIIPPIDTTPTAITSFSANPSGVFSLAAGASRTIIVTAQIPPGTAMGDYDFSVEAQAVGGSTKSATGRISVTSGGVPFFVGTATVTPNPVSAGKLVTITHTVRNSGNLSAAFSFGVVDLPSGWTLQRQENTCPVPVPIDGTTCTVTTEVNVLSSADGGSYSVGVSATADNGASGTSPEDVTISATAPVNVAIERGVSLSTAQPSATQAGIYGTVLTYTHTLTNIGNAPDGFTLSFTPIGLATAGMAVLTPASFSDVPRNGTRSVTLVVTIPSGVPASDLDFVITATSQGDSSKTAEQTDTATVSLFDAASLSPGSNQGGVPGAVLTFTHTLTNTGSSTIAYDITATNSHASFAAPVIVSGTTTPVLNPGQTTTVTIQVTMPSSVLGGTANITTVAVRKAGESTILASATDESIVGDVYNVLITPDREGTGYPNATLVFTHTVRNVGITPDTYTITALNSLSWPISVSPDILSLAPGQSQDVTVSIDVPNDNSTLAGAINFARIRVVSNSNPNTSHDEATEQITIGKVVDLVFTAEQSRAVTPRSGTIRMRDLVLTNNGNGPDIVDFTVLGADNGWTVTMSALDVLGPHDTDYNVSVQVTVPANVEPNVTKVITIQARSRYNPSEVAEVNLRFIYIAPTVVITYRTYLPLLAK